MGPEPAARRPWGEARAAALVFGAYVAVSLPVIVFVLADHRWFFRDEWAFLSGRDLSVPGLFDPHSSQHLVAVPVLIFRILWRLFGANTYVPYQVLIAAMHLAVVVLLRTLLRRLEVGPWLATAAASLLVLWGPAGGDNITWAFQVQFVGSVMFGLGQLLLADHEGKSVRRDALALTLGLLGVLSSGIGVTMAVVVGVALWLRRGWRAAAVQTLPLAAVVLVWAAITHPSTRSPLGPPPDLGTTVQWVGWSFSGVLAALGRFTVVEVLMVVLVVVGLPLSIASGASHGWGLRRLWERLRPAAIPLATAVGAITFPIMTAQGRWFYGERGAQSGRYLYIIAVLLIPVLAFSAEAVARRWPRARVGLVGLLLLPIPFNLDGFDEYPFSTPFFAHEKALLTGTVEMPVAREVPRRNHPPGFDETMGDDMTIGFLLDARAAGRLPAPEKPLSPELRDELTIRIAIQQHQPENDAPACAAVASPLRLDVTRGDIIHIDSPVAVSLARPSTDPPVRVIFDPRPLGSELTVQLDGYPLIVASLRGAAAVRACVAGS